jgi:hypothetical protein
LTQTAFHFAWKRYRSNRCEALAPDGGIIASISDLPDKPFRRRRVQPCLQKYPSFHLTQITGLCRAIPFPIEGRFAIVTDVGFGMRWTRRLQGTNEADAHGEVVWS